MGSPFDIKALQSSSDPSQDYCGIDNLPENMTVPEESISSEPSVETVKVCFPAQSSSVQSRLPLLNPISVVDIDNYSFPQTQPTLHPLEQAGKEAKPPQNSLHFETLNFFAALSGKIRGMRSQVASSPKLLKPYAELSHSQLRDPEAGVTFDKKFTPLQPAGEAGGVLSAQNKTEPVTKHKVVFSDVSGNEIPQPDYLKERTYDGIQYQGNDFKYFDPNGVRGAKPVNDLGRNVDLMASADIVPEKDETDRPIAFLPHPTGYQITAAYDQSGHRLDLYQTVAGDYFVRLSALSEEKINWRLAKEEEGHFGLFHPLPQFYNGVNVDWNSIDPQLHSLAHNAYSKEGMQLFLDYFATRTSYSWNNYSHAQSKEELARDLLIQSNCSAANLMAADLLSQQGIPVRFVAGYTADGIGHAWLEAKMREGNGFEHWEVVDFTGKIRNPSSGRVPLAARAYLSEELQKIKLPNVMRGNEIKPVQDLRD